MRSGSRSTWTNWAVVISPSYSVKGGDLVGGEGAAAEEEQLVALGGVRRPLHDEQLRNVEVDSWLLADLTDGCTHRAARRARRL